ncbi:MAG: hypothetical protein WKG07_50120 [Hymenobacter sp.]
MLLPTPAAAQAPGGPAAGLGLVPLPREVKTSAGSYRLPPKSTSTPAPPTRRQRGRATQRAADAVGPHGDDNCYRTGGLTFG